jgi:integral membrane sensor domain MASE1
LNAVPASEPSLDESTVRLGETTADEAPDPPDETRRRTLRVGSVWVFMLVALGYAGGYLLASNWFSAENLGASFFPSAGLTLAALVLLPRRQWPVVLGAAAAAELVLDLWNGTGIAASAGYALANTAEPLVGALLLLAAVGGVDLRRRRDLTAFLVSAVLAAPVLGATIAATTFVFVDDHTG